MAPEDIHKTAFVTQFGAAAYVVMPFGLSHAPAQFTQLMNSVLDGLACVIVFTDDILVVSKTFKEQHVVVRAVM